MFRTILVEKIKIAFHIQYFLENRAVYEMMCENIVHPNRPQMMRMRIACWITKATDTHSEYVKRIALPQQPTLLNVTFLCTVHVLL
jgi:hypothetical protein